eukprot:16229-Chlamydomonas_euryale.AAC.1
MDGWMDGWMDWMDGWVDGRMGGWIDGWGIMPGRRAHAWVRPFMRGEEGASRRCGLRAAKFIAAQAGCQHGKNGKSGKEGRQRNRG